MNLGVSGCFQEILGSSTGFRELKGFKGRFRVSQKVSGDFRGFNFLELDCFAAVAALLASYSFVLVGFIAGDIHDLFCPKWLSCVPSIWCGFRRGFQEPQWVSGVFRCVSEDLMAIKKEFRHVAWYLRGVQKVFWKFQRGYGASEKFVLCFTRGFKVGVKGVSGRFNVFSRVFNVVSV